MKRERRHELHHNELLEWLNKVVDIVQPHANLILAVLLLAVVATGAWAWWTRSSAKRQATAWDELYGALSTQNPAEVLNVAEEWAGSEVAEWAAVLAGDMYLSQGCDGLFASKATAAQELRKAVDEYLTVLKESSSEVIRERATFGLARAYEALAGTREGQGGLDKAIARYKEVIEKWPNGTYTSLAAQRLKDLNNQATRAFYDKFAKYDPQRALPSQPAIPGEPPPFSLDGLDGQNIPDFSEALGLDLDDSDRNETSSEEQAAEADEAIASEGEMATEGSPARDEGPTKEDAAKTEPTAVPDSKGDDSSVPDARRDPADSNQGSGTAPPDANP